MSQAVANVGEKVGRHAALYPTFGMVATRIWDRPSANLVPYMGPDLTKALATYLTSRLDAEGHTVKSFAKASGQSTGTIDRAKRAEVSIGLDKLEGIAKALGMRPWELLREIDKAKPTKEKSADVFVITSPDEVAPLSDIQKHFLMTVKTIMGRVPDTAIEAIDKMMWAFVPKIADEPPHIPSKKPSKKKVKA